MFVFNILCYLKKNKLNPSLICGSVLHRRKVMTNLDSILKSRDITLPTKSSQSYGFSGSHIWM